MKCELCGTEVMVVGDVTKHYEPLWREQLEATRADRDLLDECNIKLNDELAKERERSRKLVEAFKKEYPCDEHIMEPNTTMDFFRCDKCGIRPRLPEAIAEYELSRGKRE